MKYAQANLLEIFPILSAQMVVMTSFLQMFIVLGYYNFEANKNKQKVVTSYITQKLLDFITMLSGRLLTDGLCQYVSPKMEETQMEIFNFLWLILDHYLPLTPTKNDWPPWHPQGGCKFTQKANLLGKTMNTKVPWHL